ncbi:DUF2169 domain-containing protein [Archangium violaceum]|uniref:DUF2169 family type VI secretion system accessory protein n=1 Tax=Archangium violaceum TaxID=83451 RepID=UPI002B31E23F|nr:DUF2169 domain-containing protein [Archangium violaceum]
MGHASIENKTPLVLEPLFLADEEMRPLLTLVVKATYDIGRDGLTLADEQVPVNVAGEYWGVPEESGYRYEPECAFIKPATDVVLVGHACAPAPGTTEVLVALQVGPVRKAVRVVGERVWFKSMGSISMTKPRPFERIPLRYERAFGGWDRTDPDPAKHGFEPRNPVGVGFRASPRHFEEGLRLPNLEDPEQPLQRFGQAVAPASFGFVSPHWQPRASFAGTYDGAWTQKRKPLLPKDFNRRYFNAASPGLVAPGFLQGGEPVALVGASPLGRLAFALPRVIPKATVELAGSEDVHPALNLDTLILDTDEHRAFLLWRASVPLRDGPHDVRSVRLEAEGLPVVSTESGEGANMEGKT